MSKVKTVPKLCLDLDSTRGELKSRNHLALSERKNVGQKCVAISLPYHCHIIAISLNWGKKMNSGFSPREVLAAVARGFRRCKRK